MNIVTSYSAKLRAAVEEGKLKAFHGAFSPADTVADTRYRVRTNDGEMLMLFQSEIRGFIAGLYRSE